ncbi:MAG: hypothetical protein DCF25_13260 [Leptolyngbya foveolarum]|uniref:SAM-dependent chlorinase/fluorinase n=1 Tax=Leptolyngbya foveolarum TaxID=47253 RepID=A0A2W4U8Y3_9CYAN|nr:MAG: hypothetical protein DCF25_13260 [Leptolyngbya foveolarum]
MITILTDFGYQDAYVAVMKGVIASIAPDVKLCDLTHCIPPQNILAARFNLMLAYPYFPSGTVHLAVVDPGVGSARRGVAIQVASGFLVGPDNGLFSGVLEREVAISAVALTNPVYWRTDKTSCTFHGRDIFAPVAAHLASGVSMDALGDRLNPHTLVQPQLPPVTQLRSNPVAYAGSLQYIDSFGNLISNIPGDRVPGTAWRVVVEGAGAPLYVQGQKTYSDVSASELVALVGSHGWVEIACNSGSAAQRLQATMGLAIVLEAL